MNGSTLFNKSGVFVPGACVLLFSIAAGLATLSPAAGPDPGIECELAISRGPFIPWEPIWAQVTVRNTAKRRIGIYKPSFQDEFSAKLVIEGPGGNTLPYTGERREGPVTPFVSLAPGGTLISRENIITYYWPLDVGRYKAYALCLMRHAKVRTRGQRWAITENELWIRSNEVEFDIEKPNGRLRKQIGTETTRGDGSSGVKVNWEVLTHVRGGKVLLYARRSTRGYRLLKLGQVSSRPRVCCAADWEGNLHVLYRLPGAAKTYAYDVISSTSRLARMGRYKPAKKDRFPALVSKVYLENAEPLPTGEPPKK